MIARVKRPPPRDMSRKPFITLGVRPFVVGGLF
jgi:hypothetical protein